MKFLIVTIEGGGNIPPILYTVRKLSESCHSVYILSEPWFKTLAQGNGATFIAFREYFTKTDRKQDIMEDWKDHKNFKFMFDPTRIVVNETIEAIRNYQIDALIADVLTPCALIAAEAMNIHKVMLFHMPEYLPGANRPPGGLGLCLLIMSSAGYGIACYQRFNLILTNICLMSIPSEKSTT